MTILIFEDSTAEHYYPLSDTRPLWGLRSGCFTNLERIRVAVQKKFGDVRIHSLVRKEMVGISKVLAPDLFINETLQNDEVLLINALLVCGDIHIPTDSVVQIDGRLVAARLSLKTCGIVKDLFDTQLLAEAILVDKRLTHVELPQSWFFPEYIWDYFLNNEKIIKNDISLLDDSYSAPDDTVTVIGDRSKIYVGRSCRIDPYVCLDTTNGPIVFGEGCVIKAFTNIEGPCYFGAGTLVNEGKIRPGCSFGPVCKLSGEVEHSIFQGYSNKHHDGFMGHAYLGEWVNIAAQTSNSDLRNDYRTISVCFPHGKVDSGSPKIGSLIGDHVKTSIGCLINTGCVIGTGSMIIHSGLMTPPVTPDFCIYIKNELRDPGSIDGCIETARIAFSRRGVTLDPSMVERLNAIYRNRSEYRERIMEEWNRSQTKK